MTTILLSCRSHLLPSLREHSPLKDRILTQSAAGCLATLAKYTDTGNARPSKYREWSDLSMRQALDAVHSGISVSKVSELYGIPRTTLNDHKLGKVKPGVKPGAPPLLSTAEEEDLVKFLLNSADIGYGRTRKEVLDIVSRLLARKGVECVVTNGWWNKFLCRHPLLASRTATLSVSRARASIRECIDNYFDLLENTLQETGLADYPALYFNMDKIGLALDPKPTRIVHLHGGKNALSISSGSKGQVTVIACVSAAAQVVPPLIVWKRKTMAPEMATGEIPWNSLWIFGE